MQMIRYRAVKRFVQLGVEALPPPRHGPSVAVRKKDEYCT